MKKNRKKSTIKKRKRRAKEKAEENSIKLKELAKPKKRKVNKILQGLQK